MPGQSLFVITLWLSSLHSLYSPIYLKDFLAYLNFCHRGDMLLPSDHFLGIGAFLTPNLNFFIAFVILKINFQETEVEANRKFVF